MHNRTDLHVKLYQMGGARHVILRNQKMLAAELGMSQFVLNRVMKEMLEDGRLRVMGKGRSSVKSYIVTDPVEWCERNHDFVGAERAADALGLSTPDPKVQVVPDADLPSSGAYTGWDALLLGASTDEDRPSS